jgi:predicted Rossmann fold nucleotide-binding protein DprA/Smf involved in DNA uptake
MAIANQEQVTAMTAKNAKEDLKQLRQQRKASIDRARKMIKDQNKKITAIKFQIKEEPRTVPEIAAALRMNASEVLIFVAALRKYGEVVEGAKDGDYFRYQLAAKAG